MDVGEVVSRKDTTGTLPMYSLCSSTPGDVDLEVTENSQYHNNLNSEMLKVVVDSIIPLSVCMSILWLCHIYSLKLYCGYLYTRPCMINHILGLKQL